MGKYFYMSFIDQGKLYPSVGGLIVQNNKNELMKSSKINLMGLTASERRFAREMAVLINMSLSELLLVERLRMPISV